MSNLTQERLKELLDYDPETGVFTWLESRGSVTAGAVAGSRRKDGYRKIKINQKFYLEHRLAWLYVHGKFPLDQIDHINGVKDDNRLDNFREVDHRENQRNTKRHFDNASGVTGVCWNKAAGKWHSRITSATKLENLGYFDNFFEACCARKSAEKRYGFHPNHGRQQ